MHKDIVHYKLCTEFLIYLHVHNSNVHNKFVYYTVVHNKYVHNKFLHKNYYAQ